MATRPSQSEETLHPEPDPRWLMVERIVTSQAFAKSARLSSFLACICELARQGKLEQINEQYIGTTVFGRKPDYDPGADSIVRSHASRLRQRLEQYFSAEGAHEEFILAIPKGSYLPVFHRRRSGMEGAAYQDLHAGGGIRPNLTPPAAFTVPALQAPAGYGAVDSAGDRAGRPAESKGRSRNLVPILGTALALVTLLLFLCGGAVMYRQWLPAPAETTVNETRPLFWRQLFSPTDQTIVVTADSGLVMLQGFTKQRVTLPMYLNGTYLQTLPQSPLTAQELNLSTRRYTSTVDLTIQSRILRMTGVDLHNTKFVYSRDLRPSEIKQGNTVLLGTYESTPWVQLFEPAMNFYFQNDLVRGVFSVINRAPKAGELVTYDSRSDDPEKTVYGLVAYRPSLNGSGKTLILEGQSMAGTEAASDFVFSDGYLLPFLRSVQRANGTIPYFELLLRSKSMSGEASRLETVAVRIEDK